MPIYLCIAERRFSAPQGKIGLAAAASLPVMAASLVGPTLSVPWTNDETIGRVPVGRKLIGWPGRPSLLPPTRRPAAYLRR